MQQIQNGFRAANSNRAFSFSAFMAAEQSVERMFRKAFQQPLARLLEQPRWCPECRWGA